MCSKKYQKILNLGTIFGEKIYENSMKNRVRKCIFFDVDFSVVFSAFDAILGGSEGSLGGLKFKTLALGLSKNSPGSVQDDPKVDFGVCLGRIFFQRWVWEGFWEGFGRNFGELLGLRPILLTLILLWSLC